MRHDCGCLAAVAERYLWPEIHLWARRLRWDLLDRGPFSERNELLALSLQLKHGQAFAVASSDPGLIEGAHAESLFFLFDESKSIDPDVFDAAEGALGGPGEALALAASTPGEPTGRFYDIHARRPGFEDWHTRHVKLDEVVAAGRLSDSWAANRARQWGERSAIYQNRVLGEFASSDADSVIPASWVEAANDRWQAWKDAESDFGPVTHLGVDVARSGGGQDGVGAAAWRCGVGAAPVCEVGHDGDGRLRGRGAEGSSSGAGGRRCDRCWRWCG